MEDPREEGGADEHEECSLRLGAEVRWAYQAMLEAACGWNVRVTYAESEAMNPPAMNEMLEKYGVENVRWTDEELAAFEQAWNEVVAEQSAADPTFKKVADSYLAFRKAYKTWGDAQALKATYLSK